MCVAFSPDGNSLAAAKYDGTMLIWELEAPQGCISAEKDYANRITRGHGGNAQG